LAAFFFEGNRALLFEGNRALVFEGNRALLFDVKDPIPEQPLKHCIALALTYHTHAKA
jgi:hypothetical protein